MVVADLDFVSLEEIVPTHAFDVAVFGDILEHLRNPWRVLEATRQILKPEGYVVASIPNIAHGAIRLALLQGRFEYAQLGILDDTHLRFFTRQTVEHLFEQSGYCLEIIERTKLPIFAASPLIPAVNKADFSPEMVEQIEREPEANTLQFVVRAFPLTLEGKYAALEEKHSRTMEELKRSQAELESVQTQLSQTQQQLARSQAQLLQTQTQLQQAQARWSETQTQYQQAQEEWGKTQTQLQQALQAWEESQNIIKAMETSKFWKLRKIWFKIKRVLGLKVD